MGIRDTDHKNISLTSISPPSIGVSTVKNRALLGWILGTGLGRGLGQIIVDYG